MKICSVCKIEKPFFEFYKDSRDRKRGGQGYVSTCKKCSKERSKRWYKISNRYRKIVRDSGLKQRYGIDSSVYWKMWEDQQGLCAICKDKPVSKYFHVDHDHSTGEIRGLLCKLCNHGLGNFRDNPQFLINAYDYIVDRKTLSE